MLRQYLQKRKEKRQKALFNTGYAFAAGELLRGRETPMSLDRMQDVSWGDNYSRFDNGMNRAIGAAIDAGLCEDDREI